MFDMTDPGFYFVLEGDVDAHFGMFVILMNAAVILGGGFFLLFYNEDDD